MSKIRIYNKFYKSDIFNTESKVAFFSPKKRNLQPSLEKTSNDIFNTNEDTYFKQELSQNKHSHRYVNKSQSDIFNIKPDNNKKIRIRNNPTNNSQIIFGTNYTDYIVKKKPKKEKFTPQYSKNSPLDIFYKQFFNEENHHKNVSTSKGYYDNEMKLNNNHILQNPRRKKINWTNRSSVDLNMSPLNSSRTNKLYSQISNIFYLPEKDSLLNEVKRKNEGEKEVKKCSNLKKKYLKSKERELKKMNIINNKKKENENNKLNSLERKQNEIIRNNKLNTNNKNKKVFQTNLNDDISQRKKIKRLIDLKSPLLNETKKQKIFQNASTNNLYDDDYYERVLSTEKDLDKTLNRSEYIIKSDNKSRNDENYIKRIFSGEGIHIYDISSNYNKIFGDGNECEFTFKVRNNDENKLKSVSQKFLKEKNIEIKPKNKIVVNRIFKQVNKDNNYNNNNNSNKIQIGNNSAKFSKDKFSNQFSQINSNYKNNKKKFT